MQKSPHQAQSVRNTFKCVATEALCRLIHSGSDNGLHDTMILPIILLLLLRLSATAAAAAGIFFSVSAEFFQAASAKFSTRRTF